MEMVTEGITVIVLVFLVTSICGDPEQRRGSVSTVIDSSQENLPANRSLRTPDKLSDEEFCFAVVNGSEAGSTITPRSFKQTVKQSSSYLCVPSLDYSPENSTIPEARVRITEQNWMRGLCHKYRTIAGNDLVKTTSVGGSELIKVSRDRYSYYLHSRMRSCTYPYICRIYSFDSTLEKCCPLYEIGIKLICPCDCHVLIRGRRRGAEENQTTTEPSSTTSTSDLRRRRPRQGLTRRPRVPAISASSSSTEASTTSGIAGSRGRRPRTRGRRPSPVENGS